MHEDFDIILNDPKSGLLQKIIRRRRAGRILYEESAAGRKERVHVK